MPADNGRAHPSPPSNHAYYLLKISKSLLLNFLEFVGILSVCPEQFASKLDDLRNLFINAHHLLNLYRPHQARESLIMMMEDQLERTREEIKEMDRVKEKSEAFLARLEAEGLSIDLTPQEALDTTRTHDGIREDEHADVDARFMWDLLDQIGKE
jgi:mediator of RNA polymerase II transcription subunit 7